MKRLILALALTLVGVGCAPYAYRDASYGRIYSRYDYGYPGYIAYPVYDYDYPVYRGDRYRDDGHWRYDYRRGERARWSDRRDFHDRDRVTRRDDWHGPHEREAHRRDGHDARPAQDFSRRSSFQHRNQRPPAGGKPGLTGPSRARVPD